LNFDNLLPCYTDFTLLEKLVQAFPKIKITIFMPINSNSKYSSITNNIFDHPEWCKKISQLPPDNFEITVHGYYHNSDNRKKRLSSNIYPRKNQLTVF